MTKENIKPLDMTEREKERFLKENPTREEVMNYTSSFYYNTIKPEQDEFQARLTVCVKVFEEILREKLDITDEDLKETTERVIASTIKNAREPQEKVN